MICTDIRTSAKEGGSVTVELISRETNEALAVPAEAVIFETLSDLGMDRMTQGRVEFVLCASALTAQV